MRKLLKVWKINMKLYPKHRKEIEIHEAGGKKKMVLWLYQTIKTVSQLC